MLNGGGAGFQKPGASLSNVVKFLGQGIGPSLALLPIQPLTHRNGDRSGLRFAGEASKFGSEATGLFVLDVETHGGKRRRRLGSFDARRDPRNNEPRRLPGFRRVGRLVKLGGHKIRRAQERQLPVATETPGCSSEPVDVLCHRGWQPVPFRYQQVRHIVHSRRMDSDGMQQPMQGEFDDLLRFADDIGPALRFLERIERP